MSKIAWVFPGQGSQSVGMGRDAFDASPAARLVFEAADAALGESLSGLCFEGPADALSLTANTQPAILTTSIALLRALEEAGPLPVDVMAGHSLGEYSAHVAAGTLRFDDAVRVVRQRGLFMQEAVPVGTGAMAAVLKAERELVERVCAGIDAVVEPVNFNSPGQIVIAGSVEGVQRASEALTAEKARVMALPVSAPFHSSLMRPAEERLAPLLDALPFADPRVPVYVNVDAAPVTAGAAARDALVRQVSRAVRWDEAVVAMIAAGVSVFVEVGPGKVLSGLLKRIDKNATAISVQSMADVGAAREALLAARS
ncbi:MAG: ACP S-malonyltransferase [Sandaracinaceae bacterium]|jgi:[acyl-carrier-protein] S-malonyltransferase|nr:ACP S-malonyltransferase [Sandaracinaceae bacterium]MBK7154053.1 ACP S-malonyltransferase [Sandaracinaceae bacterium]MBP7681722.1 ACP S-malonyltransferase [Deltaproteobacteria bacterium]